MKVFTKRKRASSLAIALALATGAVVTTGVVGFAEPAQAQRKGKSPYSKEFVEAYTPLNEAVEAEGSDIAALKPQLMTLLEMAANPDEQFVAGGLAYNAAGRVNDMALQLEGMEMMLASGKVAEENVGRYTYIAYQLANNTKDFTKARTYLQRTIDIGFTPAGITKAQLNVLIAESYFGEERFKEGLAALKSAIETQKAQGQPVEEGWYRRGLSIAYNNRIQPEVFDFTTGWVGEYPSSENWRDAINLARNLGQFESPEMLDLMRLGARVGSLSDKQDIIIYVEAADARRSPLEVKNLIEGHFATNAAARDDIYLNDQLQVATQRIPVDRPELPDLAADADATTTDTKIVMAAADAFFSYGEYDKAERFFAKAVGMPGVEEQVALTRLGISQIALGKIDEAKATLAKVEGVRKPIASLWSVYAEDQRIGG